MKTEDRKEYLSTGQVAKLMSVTPDTVLKWIKKGKIAASRTAGGHYRIHRDDLGCLLETRASFQSTDRDREPMFCWEYHSKAGAIKAECRDCLVYRARARRCYEMSDLSKEIGFQGTFCKTTCEDCQYYKEHMSDPVSLLVVTDSVTVGKRLLAQESSSAFSLEFATSVYECSARVESFHPEYIVVDSSLPREAREELVRHLEADSRIPDATIILAVEDEEDRPQELTDGSVTVIGSPFDLSDVKEAIDGLARKSEENEEVEAQAG